MNTKKIDLKAGQNGTSANGQTNGNTSTAVVINQPKKETATPEQVLQEVTEKKEVTQMQPLSIPDILQKVNRLNELAGQRSQAKKTVEKLRAFNPELTEAKTTITIEDENGNEFSTSNTEALKLIIAGFLNYSQNRLSDIEAQLQKLA